MLLNTAQVASRLKIPVATVRRFAIEGQLPDKGATNTKGGHQRHHYLFDSADVNAVSRSLVRVGRHWRIQSSTPSAPPPPAPAPELRAASAPPLPVLGLFSRLDAVDAKLDALTASIDRLLKLWS